MDIRIEFHDRIEDCALKNQLLSVLMQCDNDFFPPLSSKRKAGTDKREKLILYLQEKGNHKYILAWEDKKLIGFLNFIHGYKLTDNIPLCNFADTTCILSEFRNRGVAQKIYHYLEEKIPSKYWLDYIVRETWSTNKVQIKLYEKLGYNLLLKKENARSQGVHSVIYGKRVRNR